ncbi:hypothetical protein K1J50_03755 [Caldovatus sp. SYSU G05006]|uniref:Uncharacterized protein n=1 Tax=Caldovatus aquaticus TaxID=2865671 RepID=A0ABS7EZE7_9PROT|nr:hypothetical protein [Caldovatus aquaticus]
MLRAWDAAREAATARLWGPPRMLVFHRAPAAAGDAPPEGDETTEIAIADPDARCWAEAIDRLVGLDSLGGLALCLRLLALVEVMTRAAWLADLFDLAPGGRGIALHPSLLGAAARLPLDATARFDEAVLARLLSRPLPPRLGVPAA